MAPSSVTRTDAPATALLIRSIPATVSRTAVAPPAAAAAALADTRSTSVEATEASRIVSAIEPSVRLASSTRRAVSLAPEPTVAIASPSSATVTDVVEAAWAWSAAPAATCWIVRAT